MALSRTGKEGFVTDTQCTLCGPEPTKASFSRPGLSRLVAIGLGLWGWRPWGLVSVSFPCNSPGLTTQTHMSPKWTSKKGTISSLSGLLMANNQRCVSDWDTCVHGTVQERERRKERENPENDSWMPEFNPADLNLLVFFKCNSINYFFIIYIKLFELCF